VAAPPSPATKSRLFMVVPMVQRRIVSALATMLEAPPRAWFGSKAHSANPLNVTYLPGSGQIADTACWLKRAQSPTSLGSR